jgi:hypothetical protein
MTDEPSAAFDISRKGMVGLVRSFDRSDTDSLEDAFPAALVAPTWRALLEGGAIAAPTRVDLDRVEVRLVGPKHIELRVPIRSGDAEVVKALVVHVERWTASGEIGQQLDAEAKRLASALDAAASRPTFDHGGQGQKPFN